MTIMLQWTPTMGMKLRISYSSTASCREPSVRKPYPTPSLFYLKIIYILKTEVIGEELSAVFGIQKLQELHPTLPS